MQYIALKNTYHNLFINIMCYIVYYIHLIMDVGNFPDAGVVSSFKF